MNLAQRYLFNRFDVDRVCANAENGYMGRGEGLTFATVLLMLGEVWQGSPNNIYLYIGENRNSNASVMRDFVQIIRQEGDVDVVKMTQQEVRLSNGMVFKFIPAGQHPDTIRGITFDRVFVDLTADTMEEKYSIVVEAKSRERA